MFLVHFSLVTLYVVKEIVNLLVLQPRVIMLMGGISIQILQFLLYGK
jgi:hypothetical protein